ncbi:MAG: DUF58 domain-containing protein [Candidatus Tectomicrobia bacterium]|uniref:DUF58 domain-containing protein n=1 Tax=Tectimicrobiota bacterium TaxID=2528274 RepID=A0A932MPC5_UNCTE|nr:DUF58 domain-containing protein [Candidatus Tectomicrobia bacterium]
MSAFFSSKEDTRGGVSPYFDPSVVARISSLELRARHVVEGLMSGIHRSRARGFSVEFEEHRAYSPGDELRHIDWKAFGKFDRYLVKQYEDETNLRAHLVVDASGSMDYGEGALTKWGYAATLAASLAHLLLRQSDAVGLMLSHEKEERMLPAKAVRGHLSGLLAGLDAGRPAGGTGIARSLERLAEGIRRRGMVVVISDLLDDPAVVARGLSLLRLKGNDVIIFHILDEAELEFPFEGLARMEDVETDRNITVECEVVKDPYLGILREFLDGTRERCRSQGIDYVLLSTAEPLDRGLVRFLAWRAKAR